MKKVLYGITALSIVLIIGVIGLVFVDRTSENDEKIADASKIAEEKGSEEADLVEDENTDQVSEEVEENDRPDEDTIKEAATTEGNSANSQDVQANKGSQQQAKPAEKQVNNSTVNKNSQTETTPQPQTENNGLYFATREEAIQFGFSRLSQEEIAIYNQVSKNGLTPEEEEMALQMAYSRFTAEEIAAIEDALNR